MSDIGCWTFSIASSGDTIAANWGEPVDYVTISAKTTEDVCVLTLASNFGTRRRVVKYSHFSKRKTKQNLPSH